MKEKIKIAVLKAALTVLLVFPFIVLFSTDPEDIAGDFWAIVSCMAQVTLPILMAMPIGYMLHNVKLDYRDRMRHKNVWG